MTEASTDGSPKEFSAKLSLVELRAIENLRIV